MTAVKFKEYSLWCVYDKNGNLLPTKKPNPQFHGFGMRSIENIVKKYNGEMTFYFDDPTKTFHTIIMLRH